MLGGFLAILKQLLFNNLFGDHAIVTFYYE